MNRFLELSPLRSAEWRPSYTSDVVSWQPHIPFAFALMKALRPGTLVELGTHKGDSYLAFCEAAVRFGTGTKCRAVDTWKGDPQARLYGDEVLDELRRHHDSAYGGFSTLIRSTFDEAVQQFDDGSIDLLHIDGLHTYEAVKHDFETWRPKLSRSGVILFHDTEVRQNDFGVYRLWDELCEKFPSFSFLHGFGLGVLACGPEAAGRLPDLFGAGEADRDAMRQLYQTLGSSIAYDNLLTSVYCERAAAQGEIERLHAAVADQASVVKGQQEKIEMMQTELVRANEKSGNAEALVSVIQGRLGLTERAHTEIIASLQRQLMKTQKANRELELFRQTVLGSATWLVTKPLRWVGRLLRSGEERLHSKVRGALGRLYRALPISMVGRNGIKNRAYRCFPRLFRNTESYKLWRLQVPAGAAANVAPVELPVDADQPLVLPAVANPVVSIVVAVHGQRDCVYRCLRSLRAHRSKYSFEVIVVDDVSPDDTPTLLMKTSGIRVINNDKNLGFIKSCNKGAAVARGRLLVMLNSDTVAQPGWLDGLVDTFNAFPDAGMVGSKLVYPDGILQEAGGLIWADGSGWNVGRMGDPQRPEFNYLREVDYCSGASIMVPRDLWEALGGFDEAYAPAYGEDSDLAFRVKSTGRRVFYQPASVLAHYEGMSCGRDTASGVKAYQVVNTNKLLDRWRNQMLSLGQPGVEPDKAKDRNVAGRLLVLDHCNPTPDQDAGSITAFNIMRIFRSLGWKVTFAPEDNFLHADPYTADMQKIGIECLYHPHVSSVRDHLRERGTDYDAVLVFRSSCLTRHLETIRKLAPRAKIIYHTSDLHYLREQRQAELSGCAAMSRQAEETRGREIGLVVAADATIVHSSEEKQILEKETGGRGRVFLFPWAIDIPGTESGWEKRDGVVFVGGFQHSPNADAVLHFARSIWPLVRRELPSAVFRVVGSRAPAEITGLAGDGIEILGFVPDLGELLDRTRLMVVPLRYGAGIKGKIGTSLSHGLPVVSTKVGAEGMDLGEDDGVLVADNPEEFARCIVSVYNDREVWSRASRGGTSFAERKYSLDAGREIVASLLSDLGLGERARERRPIVRVPGLSSGVGWSYPPDQPEDSLEEVCIAQNFEEFVREPCFSVSRISHNLREGEIMAFHSGREHFLHQGFCRVCGHEAEFVVDRTHTSGDVPNWRERLVCTTCGMNNRQRALCHAANSHIRTWFRDRGADVYVMERVTPLFRFFDERMSGVRVTGSEYLGPGRQPGSSSRGIRHEDAQALSFNDASFDIVVSSDVLEHVPDPWRALSEIRRILRPTGLLLLSVPFHAGLKDSVRRAAVVNGGVVHNVAAEVHGNPLSPEGSLVFTDFGWDLLPELARAGFRDASIRFYWSDVYGHLGADQNFISARAC